MLVSTLTAQNTYELAEEPDPQPSPGTVLVRVAYAGVQWGDVLVRDGHFPAPRPFVGGFEASGTVVAAGAGVDTARIGERVAALTTAGAFAELVVVPAILAIPIGDLDLRVGGAFGWVTPTACDLVTRVGRVEVGDRVLVHAAAGGVGSLAVQFARTAQAGTIVGVVADATQADYARAFGLDDVVTQDDFPAAFDGESFDVILDPIGGQTRERNVEILAAHGRLVVYGNIASWDFGPGLDRRPAHARQVTAHLQQQLAESDGPRTAGGQRAPGSCQRAGRIGPAGHHGRVLPR